MSKDKVRQLVVKILNNTGATIGSGTLYVPKEEGIYAYVITAAHVAIIGLDINKLKFKMLVNGEEKNFETNDEDSIKLHNKYDKEIDPKEYDVAVIKILREGWMKNLPTLLIGTPRENEIIEGLGFPVSSHESNLIFAIMPLDGQIRTCSDRDKRFHLILDNKLSNPSNELQGYSGSGLYEVGDEDSELVLIGIFSYGQGQNAVQNTTNGFYGELVFDICQQYGWEEPEKANLIPCSFQPYLSEAIEIIENTKVKEEIRKVMEYFIEEGIGPSSLIMTVDDLYDIPKCKRKDRTRCKVCWASRLQLIGILGMLGVGIQNLKKPIIDISNEKDVPIEFFCSEGSEGNAKLHKVVDSMFDKGLLWGDKFRENAILVWASDGKQTHKKMARTKFDRVIGDICKTPVNRMKRYDILYGEGKINNLSIVHIDLLMEAIDTIEDENVNSNLMEVFKDVIS